MNKKIRKPGRPPGRSDPGAARDELVRVASRLFGEHGFDGVSLRRVATAAHVTPAMISYYFTDKEGLRRAVLENGLDHLLAVITEIASRETGSFIDDFIRAYIHVINQDSWLPQLLVREVLSQDSSYRSVVRERFVEKAAALVPPRIAGEISAGRLRSDLDPRYVLMSVIGMCVFPYLAGPLLKPVFGYEFDENLEKILAEHTTRLFNEGARP